MSVTHKVVVLHRLEGDLQWYREVRQRYPSPVPIVLLGNWLHPTQSDQLTATVQTLRRDPHAVLIIGENEFKWIRDPGTDMRGFLLLHGRWSWLHRNLWFTYRTWTKSWFETLPTDQPRWWLSLMQTGNLTQLLRYMGDIMESQRSVQMPTTWRDEDVDFWQRTLGQPQLVFVQTGDETLQGEYVKGHNALGVNDLHVVMARGELILTSQSYGDTPLFVNGRWNAFSDRPRV